MSSVEVGTPAEMEENDRGGGVSTGQEKTDASSSTKQDGPTKKATESPSKEDASPKKEAENRGDWEMGSKEKRLTSDLERRSPSFEGFDYQIDSLNVFDDHSVDLLTGGFLEVFSPEMEKALNSFRKLRTSQEEILLSIEMKNQVFNGSPITQDIAQTLQMVPAYREKLISISRDMNLISRRVAKLKQRAQKLKELKVSLDEQKKVDEAKRRAKEKLLEAKPVEKGTPPKR